MIPFLSQEKATQFGIDCTFRIIPKSLKPYKMMTIYAIIIDNINCQIINYISINYKFIYIK